MHPQLQFRDKTVNANAPNKKNDFFMILKIKLNNKNPGTSKKEHVLTLKMLKSVVLTLYNFYFASIKA